MLEVVLWYCLVVGTLTTGVTTYYDRGLKSTTHIDWVFNVITALPMSLCVVLMVVDKLNKEKEKGNHE